MAVTFWVQIAGVTTLGAQVTAEQGRVGCEVLAGVLGCRYSRLYAGTRSRSVGCLVSPPAKIPVGGAGADPESRTCLPELHTSTMEDGLVGARCPAVV